MTKLEQALWALESTIPYVVTAPGWDSEIVAGGLYEAQEILTKIRNAMDHLLVVQNHNFPDRYMPVQGTRRNDCYRALYEIQEALKLNRIHYINPLPKKVEAAFLKGLTNCVSDKEITPTIDKKKTVICHDRND